MIDSPALNQRFVIRFALRLAIVCVLSSVAATSPPLAAFGQPAPVADRFVYRQVHMGMQVRLVVYAESEAEARRVATAAFAEIARLDAMLSSYRPDSEINRLTDPPANQRTASPELITVLARAQELAELSGGAFDVTAGPLTALWREAIERQELPDPSAVALTLSRSGYRRLRVDAAAKTVTVDPGTTLDVGGIAKGLVLDRALAMIRGEGIEAALVEAGGDLVVAAAPPGSDGWFVDVPHLGCRARLSRAALATSGDEFQFVEIEGVRYSHTVDPRTGLGVRDSGTVSVVAADGLTADGLATTLTLLSFDESAALRTAFPSAQVLVAPAGATGSETPCLSGPRPARSR